MTYNSLLQQLDKLHRHCRQGSIQTRRRYYQAARRFLFFVASEFKLQKIANASNKHLKAYVTYLKKNGKKPGYIATELAAIRFYHDQIEGRYELTTDNAELEVGQREKVGDRSWSDEEFATMVKVAQLKGEDWLVDVLTLARELGLRIHEVIRLRTADAEHALKKGELRVKGKDGLVRRVPLTPLAKDTLKRTMERRPRGASLFVPQEKKAHQIIKKAQYFIWKHRMPRPGWPQLTLHGARYTYAQKQYRGCLNAEKTRDKAEKYTALHLGHRCRRVTRTYVGPFEEA